jgi:type IV pilus assembly protein PilM
MPALWTTLSNLLQDPAPDFVFEVSEAGIAFARPAAAAMQVQFHPLEAGVLSVSPLADNILKPDAFADAVRRVVGGGARKRRRGVLILPDYCARVAVLEFDKFPADPKEQASLVKFRMKKSVPFDVETAAVSFYPQVSKAATDVVVVVAALEIVARYEAPFRASGLQPGHVTTSAIAMSELNRAQGISILARLNGRVLSVLVMNGPVLKLVRSVELSAVNADEVLAVLFPTVAYVEDEMGTHPARLTLCGFDQGEVPDWAQELGIPVEQLRSRLGTPNQNNAGLLGYLESTAPGARAA